MSSFLRDNLPYKIAALVFAVLLHFYVVGQQSPARMMTVPLKIRGLPPNLILGTDVPHTVLLTLTGPADEVDGVTAGDVAASIDLSHARAGKSMDEHVLVKAPGDVQADPSPETVTVSLAARETRRLAVAAADPGAALPGYRFDPPLVSPRYVTISGSQDAVDSVHQVVVKTDAPAGPGSVNGDFDVVPQDVQGNKVADVTVTPARAHVVIRMVSAPVSKDVPVVPDVVGALPPGRQVLGTDIRPRVVLITGSAARLSQVASVGTAPVDISNAVTTVTRTVNCLAPPGVTLSSASAVVVTVQIGPPSAAPAAPAPAAPAPVPPAPAANVTH